MIRKMEDRRAKRASPLCPLPSPWNGGGRPYTMRTTILQRIWLERLRQKQLLREARILFDCASPVVDENRKLRALLEEVGEVAKELDRIEAMPSIRHARNDLRDELTQVAAVAIAWLEALEDSTGTNGGNRR